MSGISGVVTWAGDHPVIVGVGVFAIGGLILLSLSKGAPTQSDGGMGAFYAAQAAQNASNNSVALAQVQGATETAVAGLAANQNVAINASNNATATTLGLALNDTAQQGQKQQFFLDTGEQQIEGAIAPYVMHDADAADIFASFNAAGTGYSAAH